MSERIAGRFTAVERLDSGDSVETYEALDEAGGVFAVDVLHPADATDTRRLGDAMYAVAALASPNIPRVWEWGTDDSGFYVVREYIDGWDIPTLLSNGPLDPLRVARYGAEVALGLSAAHAAGLLHGSLRTRDVMVEPEGTVKVLGMGETLPRVLAASGPSAATHFLAPELIAGEAPTEASDIYALGVVLYEMATSVVPFEGETARDVADLHLEAQAEPARCTNPDVPASLEVVIARAMRKEPEERYRSAAEMAQDLTRVGDQIESGTLPPEVPAGPRIEIPRWMWITAAALIATLVIGGGTAGIVWWRRSMTAVPSLVGLAPDAARAKIAEAGLEPGALFFTPTVTAGLPEGVVSTQSPLPGGWVRVGTGIGVVINGPRKVRVPTLEGATQASAIATIQASGLTVAGIEMVFGDAEKGTVVTQTPTAGTPVPKGSGITVSVSQGPKVAVVPAVAGEAEAAAQTSLKEAGFKTSSSRQFDDTVALGTVISQSPAAASTAGVGETVALVVSGGPSPVTVPTVKGSSLADAISALQAANLKVSVSSTKVAASVAGGTKANPAIGQVLSQSPAAGASAKAGDTVTLTFGLP